MKGTKSTPKSKRAFTFPTVELHGAATHGPIYAAAFALFVVYAVGWFASLPFQYAVGMVGVTFMAELLKPTLGPALRRAESTRDRALLIASLVACIALGSLGGTVALTAADEGRRTYAEAQQRLAAAEQRLADAQAALERVPTCTPDMPASRCAAQTEHNAATLHDRTLTRDEARIERDGARAALAEVPVPGPGLPHIEWWQKALVIGGIEFVIFAVPFATYRAPPAAPVTPQAEQNVPAAPKPKRKPQPVNDGGWAARRAKYGPTGRKPKRQLKLVG